MAPRRGNDGRWARTGATLSQGGASMKHLLGILIVGLALAITVGSDAGEKKEPKHTIKEVMKIAHKGGLMKKVAAGKASPEETKQLAELYKSLSENKPPKGELADWKNRTVKLLET